MPCRRDRLVGATLAACLVAAAAVAVGHAAGAHASLRASSAGLGTSGGSRATNVRAEPDTAAGRSLGPLRRLTPPDMLVSLPRAAPPAIVARLRQRRGVLAVAVLDRGTVRLPSGPLDLVGVQPGDVRAFTPRFTAQASALWRSVASGELTVSYARAARLGDALGAVEPIRRAGLVTPVRIGAFASLGLGHAQGLVDLDTARRLGLPPARAVLVSAPRLSIDTLRRAIRAALGQSAVMHVLRPQPVRGLLLSAYARATIPPSYLALYRAAATTCPGLPWTVLAAIGAVETRHGADTRTSSKGAMGPMQFLPSTFVAYAVDGDGDGVANIQDPADAVYSAARYLCLWGAGRGGQSLDDAIWAYNHADWYVRDVIRLAIAYS